MTDDLIRLLPNRCTGEVCGIYGEEQEYRGQIMKLELNDIHTLIGWVAETGLSLLEYEDAGMKIKIGGAADGNGSAMPVGKRRIDDTGREIYAGNNGENSQLQTAAESGSVSVQENQTAVSEDPDAFRIIESPLVGTFFAAPAEDAEPYIHVGDTIARGQVLGIVEAMKLMNEIEADCDGVVEEILVKNEQMVEYGQPLIKIRISKS